MSVWLRFSVFSVFVILLMPLAANAGPDCNVAQSQTVAQSAGENTAAFDAATSRVRDAQKWLPGSMRASTDQVVGAVGEIKGKNVKMTRSVRGRVVDAVRAILRGPKALADALKKLSPAEVLKMEEQKAWSGN